MPWVVLVSSQELTAFSPCLQLLATLFSCSNTEQDYEFVRGFYRGRRWMETPIRRSGYSSAILLWVLSSFDHPETFCGRRLEESTLFTLSKPLKVYELWVNSGKTA